MKAADPARTDLYVTLDVRPLFERWDPCVQPVALALFDRYVEELTRESAGCLSESQRVPEVGALDAWRNDLRRHVGGQRADRPSSWKLDALWEAACLEAQAREYDAMGLPLAADSCRAQAVEVLIEADHQAAA